MSTAWLPPTRQSLGRYELRSEIASGGMATVHWGRLRGPAGFSRTVAIKRLHPQLAGNPDFAAMLLDEARLVARIRHPNIISVLDVVSDEDELLLVMEYVPGESLAALCAAARKSGEPLPARIAATIMAGALFGLQAAHEATDEDGHPLAIVHRDVSPKNILVGADGVARVFDFGIAQAARRAQTTREGQIKGTLPYMSPEQARGGKLDRRSDVFSAGAVLWEILTGRRRFVGDNPAAVLSKILEGEEVAPSAYVPGLPAEIDALVLRALRPDPEQRFATAKDMAVALEQCVTPATPREVGEWVEKLASETLRKRAQQVLAIESERDEAQTPVESTDDKEAPTSVWPGVASESTHQHKPSPVVVEPSQAHSTTTRPWIVLALLLAAIAVLLALGALLNELAARG